MGAYAAPPSRHRPYLPILEAYGTADARIQHRYKLCAKNGHRREQHTSLSNPS